MKHVRRVGVVAFPLSTLAALLLLPHPSLAQGLGSVDNAPPPPEAVPPAPPQDSSVPSSSHSEPAVGTLSEPTVGKGSPSDATGGPQSSPSGISDSTSGKATDLPPNSSANEVHDAHATDAPKSTGHARSHRRTKKVGFKGYIYPGNFEVGGSLDFRVPFGGDASTGSAVSFSAGAQLKYYVLLGLGIGGALEGGANTAQTVSGTTTTKVDSQDLKVGAAVTYYFFTHEHIALGATQTGFYVFSRSTTTATDSTSGGSSVTTTANGYALLRTALNFEYFLNPAIALGPAVAYEREIANSKNTGHLNRFLTLLTFKMFL